MNRFTLTPLTHQKSLSCEKHFDAVFLCKTEPANAKFRCWVKDSNLRSPEAADLQSALVDHLSNPARVSMNGREKGTFFPGNIQVGRKCASPRASPTVHRPVKKLFGKIIVLFHARSSIFKEQRYYITKNRFFARSLV